MAYTNYTNTLLHSPSLSHAHAHPHPWDLHNLGLLNDAHISPPPPPPPTSYNMDMSNAASACMVLPNADNYSNLTSTTTTGYLEDALIEFGARFKRRKLMRTSNTNHNDIDQAFQFDPLSTLITNDLGYWSNSFANYNMHSEEELNHARLLATHHHGMHDYFSQGERMEKSIMEEMCEELMHFPESNNNKSALEEIVSVSAASSSCPKLKELSTNYSSTDNNCVNKWCELVYCSSDSSTYYSTDSSSSNGIGVGEREMKNKKRRETRISSSSSSSSSMKMVYPFGLVKPGGEYGDITLNDINLRILRPPTRPLKHPVGDFASRPAVSPNGPGLSGKAVVAFTKIQTQGRGTITIIRTKG